MVLSSLNLSVRFIVDDYYILVKPRKGSFNDEPGIQ